MEAHHLAPVAANPEVDDFRPGDSVRVTIKVRKGPGGRRSFEGVVLRRRGRGPGESFTVRRVSQEVGVERTFSSTRPSSRASRSSGMARCVGPASTTSAAAQAAAHALGKTADAADASFL